MKHVNNYITVRNVTPGLRPHVVTFDDTDEADRRAAYETALQHARGRPLRAVASLWKPASSPFENLGLVGAEVAYAPAYRLPRRGRGTLEAAAVG